MLLLPEAEEGSLEEALVRFSDEATAVNTEEEEEEDAGLDVARTDREATCRSMGILFNLFKCMNEAGESYMVEVPWRWTRLFLYSKVMWCWRAANLFDNNALSRSPKHSGQMTLVARGPRQHFFFFFFPPPVATFPIEKP